MFAAAEAGRLTHTAGYLIGFLAAAGLVSLLRRPFPRIAFGQALAVCTVGTAVIFVFGLAWLGVVTGSAELALQQGLFPFVGWAAVKIGLVAALVQVTDLFGGR